MIPPGSNPKMEAFLNRAVDLRGDITANFPPDGEGLLLHAASLVIEVKAVCLVLDRSGFINPGNLEEIVRNLVEAYLSDEPITN